MVGSYTIEPHLSESTPRILHSSSDNFLSFFTYSGELIFYGLQTHKIRLAYKLWPERAGQKVRGNEGQEVDIMPRSTSFGITS
jgi:hypothetical protein